MKFVVIDRGNVKINESKILCFTSCAAVYILAMNSKNKVNMIVFSFLSGYRLPRESLLLGYPCKSEICDAAWSGIKDEYAIGWHRGFTLFNVSINKDNNAVQFKLNKKHFKKERVSTIARIEKQRYFILV